MIWTVGEFEVLLQNLRNRQGDTTSIEVKRASQGIPQNLGETICAFANMPDGGTIILGVEEKQHFAVTGISNEAELEAAIATHARNDIEPAPYVEFQTLDYRQRKVLIASVQGLGIVDKPALYKKRAYLRQSDGDYVMTDAELRMLEVEKLHASEQVSYDEQPVRNSSVQDLDSELVQNYLAQAQAGSRRLKALESGDVLRATGVTTPDQTITLAGSYGLGFYPQGANPALSVTAAVQLDRAEGAGRNANLRHFDGPVPALLEELSLWVEQNLPTRQVYAENGHLYDQTVLPMNAVREVLANALVHRDLGPNTLGLGKSVQVRITRRCLVVESPGGLRGVSAEQLHSSEYAQAAVNQRLYQLMRNVHMPSGARVIEGEGGGLREVKESLAAVGAPEPVFTDTGVKFRVTLWFPTDDCGEGARSKTSTLTSAGYSGTDFRENVSSVSIGWAKLGKNVPAVLNALADGGEYSKKDLAVRSGLSETQVRYALDALLREQLVEMSGQRGSKKTSYRLGEQS